MRALQQGRPMAVAGILAMGLATIGAQAQTVFTEPAANLGQVNSFVVLKDPSHTVEHRLPYSKQLSFSLAGEADMRMDLRYVGNLYKGLLTQGFRSPSLALYDSTHKLIGNATPDATFTGNICNGPFSSQQCTFNQGLTLSQRLSAGQYTLEFSGQFGFGSTTTDLYFGVSKADAAVLRTYLQQLTPANAVPEASTTAMWLLGGLAGGVLLRRRARCA